MGQETCAHGALRPWPPPPSTLGQSHLMALLPVSSPCSLPAAFRRKQPLQLIPRAPHGPGQPPGLHPSLLQALTERQPPARGCQLWDAVVSRHGSDHSLCLRGAGVYSPPSRRLHCSTLPFEKGNCSFSAWNVLRQQPWQTPLTFQDPAQVQFLHLTLTQEAFPGVPTGTDVLLRPVTGPG